MPQRTDIDYVCLREVVCGAPRAVCAHAVGALLSSFKLGATATLLPCVAARLAFRRCYQPLVLPHAWRHFVDDDDDDGSPDLKPKAGTGGGGAPELCRDSGGWEPGRAAVTDCNRQDGTVTERNRMGAEASQRSMESKLATWVLAAEARAAEEVHKAARRVLQARHRYG